MVLQTQLAFDKTWTFNTGEVAHLTYLPLFYLFIIIINIIIIIIFIYICIIFLGGVCWEVWGIILLTDFNIYYPIKSNIFWLFHYFSASVQNYWCFNLSIDKFRKISFYLNCTWHVML